MHGRTAISFCGGQCSWLEQNLPLGSREDIDAIGRAFEKIYEHLQALNTRDLLI
jgi:hypothetical protein